MEVSLHTVKKGRVEQIIPAIDGGGYLSKTSWIRCGREHHFEQAFGGFGAMRIRYLHSCMSCAFFKASNVRATLALMRSLDASYSIAISSTISEATLPLEMPRQITPAVLFNM